MDRVLTHFRRNVVAYVAVVLAIGGTAYATDKIGSKQIKDNAIKERHIAPGAVGASDIANGAVGAAAVRKGAIGDAQANESDFGVIRTDRVTIDDPAAAGETTKTLLTRGPFSISIGCTDGGPTMAGVTYALHTTVRAWAQGIESGPENMDPTATRKIENNGASGTTAEVEGPETAGVFVVDEQGRFLNVAIHVVRKPNGGPADCAAVVSGFGR